MSEEMSDNMSGEMSEEMSDNMSGEDVRWNAEEISEDTAGDMLEKIFKHNFSQTSCIDMFSI